MNGTIQPKVSGRELRRALTRQQMAAGEAIAALEHNANVDRARIVSIEEWKQQHDTRGFWERVRWLVLGR